MVVFPNCKINIGLQVLYKRMDGYHELDSIFYPIDLHDAIEVIEVFGTAKANPALSFSGLEVNGPSEENTIYKAYQLLAKDFPQLPSAHIHLHKKIPSGAGLGGGSSDGVCTLKVLNKKFALQLSENDLESYALNLGSDCPFFVKNRPAYIKGRGEKIEEVKLDLSLFKIAIVHPGIHINTGWAFSCIKPEQGRTAVKEFIKAPISEWKNNIKNDFEVPVFQEFPEIASIKNQLYDGGALYASLSGSGSAVYGLFTEIPMLKFPAHYFLKII